MTHETPNEPSEAMVEAGAKAIYEHWRFGVWEPGDKPWWVPRGNSIMQDLARMFSQAALSAALPMATASETPGDICQLDPHGTQGGVDPEITALRAEVARLRADLASSHLDACERAIDRMGWPEINAFMAQPAQALSEDAGGYLRRKIKTLFGIKPDAVETYQHAARMMVNEARAALESTDQ